MSHEKPAPRVHLPPGALYRLGVRDFGHDGWIQGSSFLSNRQLVTGADGVVKIWDLDHRAEIARLPCDERIRWVETSPSGIRVCGDTRRNHLRMGRPKRFGTLRATRSRPCRGRLLHVLPDARWRAAACRVGPKQSAYHLRRTVRQAGRPPRGLAGSQRVVRSNLSQGRFPGNLRRRSCRSLEIR